MWPMVFDKKIPFTRNWLTEALEIANGKTDKPPKKEHVKALAEAYGKVLTQHSEMREILKKALAEAQRTRANQGLPIMPERKDPNGAA
jgi:hypothetical protein